MKKNKSALSVMENSKSFGLRAKDVLFGYVDTHEFFRCQNSNICFIDDGNNDAGDANNNDNAGDANNNDNVGDTGDTGDANNNDNAGDANNNDDAGDAKNSSKGKSNSGMSESEAQLLKEVMKWKTKAKTAQQELKDKNNNSNPILDAIGDLTAEELKTIIGEKKSEDRKAQEKRGEYDSIVTQMKEQHATDLSGKDKTISDKDAEIAELKSMLGKASSEMEELTVGRQFSDSLFIKDRATLPPSIARTLFGAHFDIADGKIVGYDKPRGDESRAPLVNGQAETLGFEAAIERLITSHPERKTLLRSTMKPGSNSSTNNDSQNGSNSQKNLTGTDRILKGLNSQKS